MELKDIPLKYQPKDMIPFKIKNLDKYIINTHRHIFPESKDYGLYWSEQAKYCVEGRWEAIIEGKYRYMPGNLYFYGNLCEIEITGGTQRKVSRPSIRDVDWYISYALAACEGFSGFSEDHKFSCFRPLKQYHKDKSKLTQKDEALLREYDEYIKKPDGSYKEYVDAREYLYMEFDSPMGLPEYFNTAKNLMLLSTRRLGKSYNIACQVLLYDLVFGGAKTLSQFLGKEAKSTTVLGSENYVKTSELLDKVEESIKFLKYKAGGYYDDGYEIPGAFYTEIDTYDDKYDRFIKKFKEKGGTCKARRTNSKIVHVSYKDNPSAGVGVGARKMIVEEAGLLYNFKQVHSENSAVQKGDFKYGFTIYIGTGGDIEKIKEIREAFYNPEGFDCIDYYNSFEKTENHIGMFIPVYYKNNIFRDKNGNIDVVKSAIYEWEEREKLKDSKSGSYGGHIISFPFLPSEMFMQSQGNRFQTSILEENLRKLETGLWDQIKSVGTLKYVDKNNRFVKWEEDMYNVLKPITRVYQENSLSNSEKKGAIVIYEHPKDYRPIGYTNNPLYIALYDPVAVEGEEGLERGTSLACVLILKLWDFDDKHYSLNVVAEWFGRLDTMDEMHNRAFLMADYYGCRLLPEIQNEDILRYAKRIGRYQDLEDAPSFVATELTKGGIVRNKKGFLVPSNRTAMSKLEDFAYEMLETPIDRHEYIDGDNIILDNVKPVHNIPSMRLNEELIHYNREGNFDGCSALFLGGIYTRNRELEPISESRAYDKQKEEEQLKSFINTADTYLKNSAYTY